MMVVGSGPTELHAHIDLDRRANGLTPSGVRPSLTVLATSEYEGMWPVVAEVHTASTGGGERQWLMRKLVLWGGPSPVPVRNVVSVSSGWRMPLVWATPGSMPSSGVVTYTKGKGSPATYGSPATSSTRLPRS